MADRLAVAIKKQKKESYDEKLKANARTSALALLKLCQTRELRSVGAAFRSWHSATWLANMQENLAKMRSETSKLLQHADEATAKQIAARRATMLRGMVVRRLHFKVGEAFKTLQRASWESQYQAR